MTVLWPSPCFVAEFILIVYVFPALLCNVVHFGCFLFLSLSVSANRQNPNRPHPTPLPSSCCCDVFPCWNAQELILSKDLVEQWWLVCFFGNTSTIINKLSTVLPAHSCFPIHSLALLILCFAFKPSVSGPLRPAPLFFLSFTPFRLHPCHRHHYCPSGSPLHSMKDDERRRWRFFMVACPVC